MTKAYKTRVDKGVRRSSYTAVPCPCGKVFEVPPSRVGRKKYCSLICKRAYATRPSGLKYEKHKDNPTSFKPGEHASPETEFKPGQRPWNEGITGTHFSPDTEFKPGDTAQEKNFRWAGGVGQRKQDLSGYAALHAQVHAQRGRAANYSCTKADRSCQGDMQWANISGNYEGVEDFMPLCRSHHVRYDGGL